MTSYANLANAFGPWNGNGDLCAPGAGETAGDAAFGALHGILSVLPIGFLVDPMAPLQKQLTDNQAKIQAMYNQASLAFMNDQVEIDDDIIANLHAQQEDLQSFINLHDELINQNINKVEIAVAFIGILTLLITFYMLVFT